MSIAPTGNAGSAQRGLYVSSAVVLGSLALLGRDRPHGVPPGRSGARHRPGHPLHGRLPDAARLGHAARAARPRHPVHSDPAVRAAGIAARGTRAVPAPRRLHGRRLDRLAPRRPDGSAAAHRLRGSDGPDPRRRARVGAREQLQGGRARPLCGEGDHVPPQLHPPVLLHRERRQDDGQIERLLRFMVVRRGRARRSSRSSSRGRTTNVFDHLSRVLPLLDAAPFSVASSEEERGVRAFASAQHPIALGAALVILIPPAVYLMRRSARPWLWWIAIVVLACGSLATLSRTSVLMLVAVAATFLWLRPRETRRLWPLLLPAILVIHFAVPGHARHAQAVVPPRGRTDRRAAVEPRQSRTGAHRRPRAESSRGRAPAARRPGLRHAGRRPLGPERPDPRRPVARHPDGDRAGRARRVALARRSCGPPARPVRETGSDDPRLAHGLARRVRRRPTGSGCSPSTRSRSSR